MAIDPRILAQRAKMAAKKKKRNESLAKQRAKRAAQKAKVKADRKAVNDKRQAKKRAEEAEKKRKSESLQKFAKLKKSMSVEEREKKQYNIGGGFQKWEKEETAKTENLTFKQGSKTLKYSANPGKGKKGIMSQKNGITMTYTSGGKTHDGQQIWGPPYTVMQEKGTRDDKSGKLVRNGKSSVETRSYGNWNDMMHEEIKHGVKNRDLGGLNDLKKNLTALKDQTSKHYIQTGLGQQNAVNHYVDFIDKQTNDKNAKSRYTVSGGRWEDAKQAYERGEKGVSYSVPKKWQTNYDVMIENGRKGMGRLKDQTWKQDEIAKIGKEKEIKIQAQRQETKKKLSKYETKDEARERRLLMSKGKYDKDYKQKFTSAQRRGLEDMKGNRITGINNPEVIKLVDKVKKLEKGAAQQIKSISRRGSAREKWKRANIPGYTEAANTRDSFINNLKRRSIEQKKLVSDYKKDRKRYLLDKQTSKSVAERGPTPIKALPEGKLTTMLTPEEYWKIPSNAKQLGFRNTRREGTSAKSLKKDYQRRYNKSISATKKRLEKTETRQQMVEGGFDRQEAITSLLQDPSKPSQGMADKIIKASFEPSEAPLPQAQVPLGGQPLEEQPLGEQGLSNIYGEPLQAPPGQPTPLQSDPSQIPIETIEGENYQQIMKDREIKEALGMKRQIMEEGISRQVQQRFSSRMADIMGRAGSVLGLRLGGVLGGSADPERVEAQRRSFDEANLQKRGELERDLALSAADIQRGGLRDYASTLGQLKKFDITAKGAAKQRKIERDTQQANLEAEKRIV